MLKGKLTTNVAGQIGKLGSRVRARLLSLIINNDVAVRASPSPSPDVVQRIYLQQLYQLTGRRLPTEYEHEQEPEGNGSWELQELKETKAGTSSERDSQVLADVSESQPSLTMASTADKKASLMMGGPLEAVMEGGSSSLPQATASTAPKRSRKKRSAAAAGSGGGLAK